MILTKQTWEYEASSEGEAYDAIEDYKAKQNTEGYTVIHSNVKYKCKKDRKTGEVIEEKWLVAVTVSYLI